MTETALFISIITILFWLGFLVPPLLRHWRRSPALSLLLALLGSGYGAFASGTMWLGLAPLPEQPLIIPLDLWKGIEGVPPLQWEFHLDSLSTFFVLLISGFSAIVAVYSFGALKAPHYEPYRHRITSAFNLFVWSTIIVVLAHDAFSLILTLEIMTVAFGYLVLYKHALYTDTEEEHPVSPEKQKDARIAPQVYMIISHTSTAFLLIALIILAILAGGFGFNQLSESGKNIEPMLATIVFLLAFAGLGIRAGLMPAHIWVSLVHPSSPTTTHALSLGIAIKVSVYLMYRFFFQFLEPQAWWGYLVLLVAVSTALVNVWYAISSHDLKTALAYHSIENIGIICVGIGVALVFQKTDRFIATLALVASLYHLLNHAIFKGLLYLGTGAIDNLTHQVVEFHKLGGLIKLYPLTSAMFLIGSFSIAGFPPFNGFISEWLTLQALFSGLTRDPWFIGLPVTLVSLVLLVASFALTAFCFYKIAGLTLLGQPRSSEKERKKWERQDVPWSMGSVMLLMAALCLALGLFPGQVIPHLAFALQPLGSVGTGWDCFPSWNGVRLNVGAGSNGLPVTLILGVALGLMLIPILASLFQQTRRPPIAWNCGAPGIVTQVAQYTSSAVSFLIRDQFGVVSATKLAQAAPDYLPARLPLSHSDRYPQVVIEIFRALDNYLIGWLLNISEDVGRTLQNRDIRRYLAYILIANLVALLLFIGLGK